MGEAPKAQMHKGTKVLRGRGSLRALREYISLPFLFEYFCVFCGYLSYFLLERSSILLPQASSEALFYFKIRGHPCNPWLKPQKLSILFSKSLCPLCSLWLVHY